VESELLSRTPILPEVERQGGQEHNGNAGKPEGMYGNGTRKSCVQEISQETEVKPILVES